MRALGQSDIGEGDTRVADVHVPRVVHVENIASTSSSIVRDGSVATEAIVKLQGVSLLAGFIKAEEIRSISRVTSIGSAASSSGDVDVIGLKIGGVDVSVTDDGFEVTGAPPDAAQIPGAGGEPFPGQSPEQIVNQVLDALGARITLFESITSIRGGAAQRMQPGLVVSVENPLGGTGAIPPGRFDIFLASTSASALASLPFTGGGAPAVPDLPDSGTDTSTSGGGGGSISIGNGPAVSGDSVDGVGDALDGDDGGAVGAIGDAVPRRSDYTFDGLPLALVLFVIVVCFVAARVLRRGMWRLMP
jgi:hypothetical protein